MNKEAMKQLLIRDKSFLQELYVSKSFLNTKRLLIYASDTKLSTLIKFLHFLANCEIRIKKANFDVIVANKRLTFIKKAKFSFYELIKTWN
jgi:hypothetical protein